MFEEYTRFSRRIRTMIVVIAFVMVAGIVVTIWALITLPLSAQLELRCRNGDSIACLSVKELN